MIEQTHGKLSDVSLFVYVIAWARGQLRINFTRISKVFTKLPESRSEEGNLENFENLSHKEQNSVQRKTSKVLPSRKQVCRLSLKNRLAVERGKRTIIVSKTQQVQFTQSNFFTNKTLSNLILFTCLAELTRA